MERTTPAGQTTGPAWAKLALAVTLAVSPMVATVTRAAEPTPQEKQKLEAEKLKAEQEKQKALAAEKAKQEAERVKAEQEKQKALAAEKAKQEAERLKLEAERKAQQEIDRRAAATLNEGKQAYEQKNYPLSVAKYREFIAQFPKRPEVMAAHYGLAMALVEMPDKDWNGLIQELQLVIAAPEVPDKGRANYWLAVATRFTGEQQLDAAKANPAAKEPIAKALERIGQSVAPYAAADAALSAAAPKPAADAKELPPAMEMAARAKVEGAEALIKLGKYKEAAAVVGVFATDPIWAKSSSAGAGLLALGQAQLAQGDQASAFRSLALVAPFEQLGVGLEARFLLGKMLQDAGDKPEAVVQYDAVAKGYLEHRRKAEEALRNRPLLAGRPLDLMRLESLVRAVPDYVAQANYNGANIQYDLGQMGDALPKYIGYTQAAPKSEFAQLAQLRAGICSVVMRQPNAPQFLQPLAEHATLGDQATWWMGRFLKASADPANQDALKKQFQASIGVFLKAAEKAAAIGKTDPAAATRRGDMLMDAAETHLTLLAYKDAAALLEQIAKDPTDPDRAEIAHEKWAMALNKDGQIAASEAACTSFLAKYPKSALRASMLFWQAENTYRQGVELAKKPEANTPPVQAQVKALQDQAVAQYTAIVEKYPEFSQASAARYGLGMSFYRQGLWEKAKKQFERVMDADRNGDLAAASYYQADCIIRTLPEGGDDALSAARLSGQLDEATKQLGTFIASSTVDRPETPDATFKLADCYLRNGLLIADQQERAKTLASARENYDKLITKYPKHPEFARAVMDRARCMNAQGDPGNAINEFNRFRADPVLAKHELAPQALVRLAELMVRHGRSVDAIAMLDKARKDYEPELAKDPQRAALIPALRYYNGMAFKEANKPKDAILTFDAVIAEFPKSPEAAECALALVQMQKDDAVNKLRQASQAATGAATLLANETDALRKMTDVATAFGEHADRLADKSPGSDLHIRTLRDAANSWRAVADTQVETLRRAKADEALRKLMEKLAKDVQIGRSNSIPKPPEIPLSAIPVQPAELKVREYYNKALEAAPDSPVCNEMRMELVQMYADRGEADPAIQLLSAAMDKNPPPEQQFMLRVKLGNALLQKNDIAGALAQVAPVFENAATPHKAGAYLVKGKALMMQKNWPEAIQVLTRFKTGEAKYINQGAISEEGLARLAECYVNTKAWEECKAAYEQLVARFGGSKWIPDARFYIGYGLQQAKQYDRAVEAYNDVIRRTTSELAARAQLQIGICRAEQKRWQDAVTELMMVPGTYDYAQWAANAWLEAGKALVELKQPTQAKDVLNRVVREHPGTEWATQAAKQLAEIH